MSKNVFTCLLVVLAIFCFNITIDILDNDNNKEITVQEYGILSIQVIDEESPILTKMVEKAMSDFKITENEYQAIDKYIDEIHLEKSKMLMLDVLNVVNIPETTTRKHPKKIS